MIIFVDNQNFFFHKILCSVGIVLVALIVLLSNGTSAHAEENPNVDIRDLKSKAKSGYADAQYSLGVAYDLGQGIRRSIRKAIKWYTKAAEQGHSDAQNSLGSIYQAERKYEKAFYWYDLSAKQNHHMALASLGYLYDLGLGVKQSREQAFELYTKSANYGWAEAMWNIANMYGAGQLGDVNLFQSCIWMLRAKRFSREGGERFDEHMKKIVFHLKLELSVDEYDKCWDESRDWSPAVNSEIN